MNRQRGGTYFYTKQRGNQERRVMRESYVALELQGDAGGKAQERDSEVGAESGWTGVREHV